MSKLTQTEERKCKDCPAFFEVKDEGLIPTGGGWSNRTIDGKDVICCRPGKTVQKKKQWSSSVFTVWPQLSPRKLVIRQVGPAELHLGALWEGM